MNKFWILIIIGVFIRLFLALTTYHSDLRTFQYAGQVIGEGNVLNIYDYLYTTVKNQEISKLVVFNYPPAIYIFHGLFNFIFSTILGSSFINGYLINVHFGFGRLDFMLHLLFIKLPYIIFDILIAVFLSKLFDLRREKLLSLILWWFNPVNLYATYMIGQFDIIPTFFVVLSLFFVKLKKLPLAALVLGIGIAFKIFPLFLLIPLALLERKWLEKLKLLSLGLIPYLLSILPFLPSAGFRSTALVASQTDKSLFAEIAVSGGEKILLFPAFLVFLYIYFLFRRPSINLISIFWQRYFITLLLFYIFTHTHPQWFLWLTPFLIIDLIQSKFKHLPLTLIFLSAFIFSTFLFEPSLTVGLFAPLFPVLSEMPSIWQLLGVGINDIFAKSLVHSVFVGTAVYYMFIYFPSLKDENA